jgi:ferredoxin-NADP reductase
MQLLFTHRREVAPHVWEYSFKPERPVWFTPGQYAYFTFPFHIADPHGKQHRTFTLTSLPEEAEVRFVVRLDPPLSVFKEPLASLQPGDELHMGEPLGDAVLPRLVTPLLFIAQGIALASYLAILHDCERSNLSHPITLVWARRDADNSLESLIPDGAPHLRRVDIHYPLRVDVSTLQPYVASQGLVYLSGSQTFVETLGTQLEANGILRERILYDYYEGYVEL